MGGDLDVAGVGGGAGDAAAFAGEGGLVLAVKLVAVTVVFDDETVAKMGHPDLDLGHPSLFPFHLERNLVSNTVDRDHHRYVLRLFVKIKKGEPAHGLIWKNRICLEAKFR
jgi:hypothetical protein